MNASENANKRFMSCHSVDNDTRTLMMVDASALVEEKNSVFDGNRNKFVFVLDFSNSMSASIAYLVDAMKDLVDEMALGSVFCIVCFHSSASVVFSTNEFTTDERTKCKEALSLSAKRLGYATNIEAGINLASKTMLEDFKYDRNEVHMLILTDGEANTGQTSYAALAALADASASTVHSCMFGEQSAVEFSARLNQINAVNSGYYIESRDALKTAFMSIFASMKADSIYATVGGVSKTIPPAAATGTLHIVFDVDPKSNPHVELTIGEDAPKFSGSLDKCLSTEVDERVLKMRVRIADAYAKASSMVTAVKTASTNGYDANVGAILESFEEIKVTAKEIEEEFESIDVKNEPAYRSLSSVCDKVCAIATGTGPGVYDSVDPPAYMDDDDDACGEPHYRSLGASAGQPARLRSLSATSHTPTMQSGSMAHKIQGLPTLVF